MKMKITFDEKSKKKFLSYFGKSVDNENFIIESDSKQRVIASDGDEVKLKDFAALHHGSEIFVKSDIVSLIQLADSLE